MRQSMSISELRCRERSPSLARDRRVGGSNDVDQILRCLGAAKPFEEKAKREYRRRDMRAEEHETREP